MARRAFSAPPWRAPARTLPLTALVVLAVLSALVAAAVSPQPAYASGPEPSPTPYAPPVDAPVVDLFRPPPDRFAAGNRGVDYATSPDTPVHASSDGLVTFAGPVGGALHVVVLHPDGIRTSYSFLASTAVRRGQRVKQGDVVGTTSHAPLHFGARVEEEYVDPLSLVSSGRPRGRARLVPDDGRGLPSEARERKALAKLVRVVRTGARASAEALRRTGRGSRHLAVLSPPAGGMVRLAHDLSQVLPDPDLAELVAALMTSADVHPVIAMAAVMADRQLRQSRCTSADQPTPAAPARTGGRRLAVLVGGLGSTSEGAKITELDTESLGYAEDDTVRFSYRGGTVDKASYTSFETQHDIAESGRKLTALIDELAAANPGVPIDVFAHSQGGLVARAAVAGRADTPVRRLVTFGTPHDGADPALVHRGVRAAPGAQPLFAIAAAARPMGLHPRGPSLRQLQPDSEFMVDLNRKGLPPTVQATSIAARRDLVVPPGRSWLRGAANVVVRGRGGNAHSALPGSPEGYREAALAVAGLPPTCESLRDAALDTASAVAVQLAEAMAARAAHG